MGNSRQNSEPKTPLQKSPLEVLGVYPPTEPKPPNQKHETPNLKPPFKPPCTLYFAPIGILFKGLNV